jgi:hypothetical protein
VEAHFGQHPDAEIYLSQPGLGLITGARVLGEFGDDRCRYASGQARRNYAGTSPITRASGKRKIVAARYVRNDRLIDALMLQAFAALRVSPGARAFYDTQRAKESNITTPYEDWPAGSSASCTAASRPAPATTRPPHGATAKASPNRKSPLDIKTPGVSWGNLAVLGGRCGAVVVESPPLGRRPTTRLGGLGGSPRQD